MGLSKISIIKAKMVYLYVIVITLAFPIFGFIKMKDIFPQGNIWIQVAGYFLASQGLVLTVSLITEFAPRMVLIVYGIVLLFKTFVLDAIFVATPYPNWISYPLVFIMPPSGINVMVRNGLIMEIKYPNDGL